MRLQGVGVGLVSVPRFERALKRFGDRLQRRIFSPAEIAYSEGRHDRSQSLASRFAAKCAGRSVLKNRHVTRLSLRDLEVVQSPSGEPALVVSGAPAAEGSGSLRFILSLAHDAELALASVWLEGVE
jgi:holo-[acyl-carrier protein] synthase